ncbi:MAG: ComEC family DNA internalization-related competence protein, partial [Chloroflexi bacterium]|nr:ComEC family DNA internalization-related competence protein [Chloroflexota bacterium]
FPRIAFLGIPATLLAMPAIPFLLVASVATAVAGLVAPFLGQMVGWIAWLPLSYLLGLVDILARLPNTVLHLETVPGLVVWAYYGAGLLMLLFLRLWRRRESPWAGMLDAVRRLGEHLTSVPTTPFMRSVTMFSLAAGVVLLWSANLSLADGRLYVTFIDVGQGDAVFIQTPQGHQVLIDGGRDSGKLLQTLGQRMPFWDRSLDLVVVSHSHEDHIGALSEVLRRYNVAAVLDNPYPFNSAARVEFLSLVEANRSILIHANQGQIIQLGEGVSMEVLNPPQPLMGGTLSDVDNNSTVIRLVYGNTSFLLTGDLGRQGELSLIDRGLNLESSVLKVSHHGSQTSSTLEFLEKVNTMLVVVPVGEDNRFDHPSPQVMDLLEAVTGSLDRVFTTAESGNITLVSDGKSITVHTER